MNQEPLPHTANLVRREIYQFLFNEFQVDLNSSASSKKHEEFKALLIKNANAQAEDLLEKIASLERQLAVKLTPRTPQKPKPPMRRNIGYPENRRY